MIQYFFGNKMVSGVRFFSYGKEHRVEFMLGGERYIEQADVLTTERPPAPTRLPERKVSVVGVDLASGEDSVGYGEFIMGAKGSIGLSGAKGVSSHKTEAEPNEELDAIEPELESELDDFKFIKVTRTSNDKSEVFENKEDYDAFVKKHNLDEEAIERVLDGEQKTHKGFTFENQ